MLDSKIKIFPNPTRDILHIQTSEVKIEQVALHRVNGQLIAEYFNVNQLPVESLEAGIYLCKILTDKGLITKKISVIR
ncbi:MAG: T9SS type A sorting domain-containing protein [Saprospiraceae bacterium]